MTEIKKRSRAPKQLTYDQVLEHVAKLSTIDKVDLLQVLKEDLKEIADKTAALNTSIQTALNG